MAEQTAPTALVVTCVQNALIAPDPDVELIPHEADEALVNIRSLLDRARPAGARVVYVRHLEPEYPARSPGHPGSEVHATIALTYGETVVDKLACDAFCGTELASVVRVLGIEHIISCGVQSEVCIDSATRSAPRLQRNVADRRPRPLGP